MKQIGFWCIIVPVIFLLVGCEKKQTIIKEEIRKQNIPVLLDDQRFNGVFISASSNAYGSYVNVYIFDGTNKCNYYIEKIPLSKNNDVKQSKKQFDISGNRIIDYFWYDYYTPDVNNSTKYGTYYFNEDGAYLIIDWEKKSERINGELIETVPASSTKYLKLLTKDIPEKFDWNSLNALWLKYFEIMKTEK
jgi:hypothetical protein